MKWLCKEKGSVLIHCPKHTKKLKISLKTFKKWKSLGNKDFKRNRTVCLWPRIRKDTLKHRTIYKDMVKNVYSTSQSLGNMSVTKVTDRGLVSRLYKDLLPSVRKRQPDSKMGQECKQLFHWSGRQNDQWAWNSA